MSLLANKMKHGNLCISSFLVIRSKGPSIEQEPPRPANPRGKRHITYHRQSLKLCVTQKTPRTPRLPGNTITKARIHPHHDTSSNTRKAGMEIIDREREKEWLEQMDTILIFVCLVSL